MDLYLPFSGKFSAENRWVKLAGIIPWELVEEIYADAFCEDFGAPALSARVAIGALLIKEREGLTDRGTVEMILRRILNHIEKLLQNPNAASLRELSKRQYKTLLVCLEVCRQQQQMYGTKSQRVDESIRSTIEGKFGQAKRRFGLSRVMAKLEAISAAQISLSFLVLNLEAALRRLLFALLFCSHSSRDSCPFATHRWVPHRHRTSRLPIFSTTAIPSNQKIPHTVKLT